MPSNRDLQENTEQSQSRKSWRANLHIAGARIQINNSKNDFNESIVHYSLENLTLSKFADQLMHTLCVT
jgi:hypothetical protein